MYDKLRDSTFLRLQECIHDSAISVHRLGDLREMKIEKAVSCYVLSDKDGDLDSFDISDVLQLQGNVLRK